MPALVVKGITIDFGNPVAKESGEDVVSGIVNFIYIGALISVTIIILIAAFFFLTSGGDPTKRRKAQDVMLYSLFGLLIILLSKTIVVIIRQIMGF